MFTGEFNGFRIMINNMFHGTSLGKKLTSRAESKRRDHYWSSSRKRRLFYFGWTLRITCCRQPLLLKSHSVVPIGIVDRSLAIFSRYLDDLLNRRVAIYGNRWQSIFIDNEKWQAFLPVTPRYIHRLKRTCILDMFRER